MPYSVLDKILQQKLQEYEKAYLGAEKAIKLVEVHTQEGLIFPAVNELRYAGNHIARSLSAENTKEAVEYVNEATRHAQRATYDAYDAGIDFILTSLREFQEDFKHIIISKYYTNYISECATISSIKNEIIQETRNPKKLLFESKICQISSLEKILANWNAARDELNKGQQKQRRQYIYLILAVITLLLAVPSSIIATVALIK